MEVNLETNIFDMNAQVIESVPNSEVDRESVPSWNVSRHSRHTSRHSLTRRHFFNWTITNDVSGKYGTGHGKSPAYIRMIPVPTC